MEQARWKASSGADFESKHNNSVLNIAAEQKKIDEIIAHNGPPIEADRAGASAGRPGKGSAPSLLIP